MLKRLTATGLLLLSLTACGTQLHLPPPAPQRRVPADLLQDCPYPVPKGKDNGALASYAGDLRTALELCNADKKGLRDWDAQL